MAVRYAALSACGKLHVCHCNSLGGATYNDNGTDGQTDRQSATQYAAPSPTEEGRITMKTTTQCCKQSTNTQNIFIIIIVYCANKAAIAEQYITNEVHFLLRDADAYAYLLSKDGWLDDWLDGVMSVTHRYCV